MIKAYFCLRLFERKVNRNMRKLNNGNQIILILV